MLDQGAHSGLRHFTCEFPYQGAGVNSCHAFRFHRPGARRFSCNFRYIGGPCEMLTCTSIAQARAKVCSTVILAYDIFLILLILDMRFACAGWHKMCVRTLAHFWSAEFYLQISVSSRHL